VRRQVGALKVEYLADGSPDCPLVRFYGIESEGFAHLHKLAEALSGEAELRVDLAQDPAFELINMERFILSNEASSGAQATTEGFEWRLERYDWETVALLLEPLIDSDLPGFQWLDELSVQSVGLPVLASRSPDGVW